MALDKAARFVGCVLRVTEAFVYSCDWRQILSLWSVIWASWGLALVPGTFTILESSFELFDWKLSMCSHARFKTLSNSSIASWSDFCCLSRPFFKLAGPLFGRVLRFIEAFVDCCVDVVFIVVDLGFIAFESAQ